MVLAVPPENWARAADAVRQRGRGGDGHRHVRGDGPAAAALSRAIRSPTSTCTSCTTAGRRWCGRRRGSRRTRDSPGTHQPTRASGRTSPTILLQNPGLAERVQQGMDHPPVRSRGAGRQRHQAAGRRPRRRPRRRGGGDAGARLVDRAWRSAAASTRATATSTPTRWRRRPSTRRCATWSRSAPTRRGSPCSTISAGATPTGRRCSARWCGRPRRAATWPWRTACRSSAARTASRTSTTPAAATSSSRRRCSSAPWAACPTCAAA